MQEEQSAGARCPLHPKRTRDYFCVNCGKAICADCGLLTTEHRGHETLSAEDAAERCKLDLQNLSENISYRLQELQEKKQKLMKPAPYLQAEKEAELARMKECTDLLTLALEEELDIDAAYHTQGFEEFDSYAQQLSELKSTITDTLRQSTQPVSLLLAREQQMQEGRQV